MARHDFGYLYILKKDFTEAERLLKYALKILESTKHDEIYRCYEYLGDLYSAKGCGGDAKTYYVKALTFTEQHFPKDSAHIARLKSKTPFIQRARMFISSLCHTSGVPK